MILAMCSYEHEDAMSRNGQLVLAIGSTLSKDLIGEFGAKKEFTKNIVEPLKAKIKENNALRRIQSGSTVEGLAKPDYLSVCDMKASWEMILEVVPMWKTTKVQCSCRTFP